MVEGVECIGIKVSSIIVYRTMPQEMNKIIFHNTFSLVPKHLTITNNIDIVEGAKGIANIIWSVFVEIEHLYRTMPQVLFIPFLV